MASFPIFAKKKEPFPVNDCWLEEREPYFGHELEGVQRDPVDGRTKNARTSASYSIEQISV